MNQETKQAHIHLSDALDLRGIRGGFDGRLSLQRRLLRFRAIESAAGFSDPLGNQVGRGHWGHHGARAGARGTVLRHWGSLFSMVLHPEIHIYIYIYC